MEEEHDSLVTSLEDEVSDESIGEEEDVEILEDSEEDVAEEKKRRVNKYPSYVDPALKKEAARSLSSAI